VVGIPAGRGPEKIETKGIMGKKSIDEKKEDSSKKKHLQVPLLGEIAYEKKKLPPQAKSAARRRHGGDRVRGKGVC